MKADFVLDRFLERRIQGLMDAIIKEVDNPLQVQSFRADDVDGEARWELLIFGKREGRHVEVPLRTCLLSDKEMELLGKKLVEYGHQKAAVIPLSKMDGDIATEVKKATLEALGTLDVYPAQALRNSSWSYCLPNGKQLFVKAQVDELIFFVSDEVLMATCNELNEISVHGPAERNGVSTKPVVIFQGKPYEDKLELFPESMMARLRTEGKVIPIQFLDEDAELITEQQVEERLEKAPAAQVLNLSDAFAKRRTLVVEPNE